MIYLYYIYINYILVNVERVMYHTNEIIQREANTKKRASRLALHSTLYMLQQVSEQACEWSMTYLPQRSRSPGVRWAAQSCRWPPCVL